MKKAFHPESGFALVAAIVLVTILAIVVAGMMSTVKTGFLWSGLFQRKAFRENLADSGIERAKAVLKNMADQEMDGYFAQFLAQPEKAIKVTSPEGVSGEDEKYKWDTYILGKQGNPLTLDLPNKFRVVTVITDKRTGEQFTVDTLVALQPVSYAKFAFAVLKPFDNYPSISATDPNWSIRQIKTNQFVYGSAIFDGPVYYGEFPDYAPPYFPCGEFIFQGPVLFRADKSSTTLFTQGNCGHLNFQQGFKDKYNLTLDYNQDDPTIPSPKDIQDKIRRNISPSVQSWTDSELCLFFKDRVVERYNCSTNFNTLLIGKKRKYFKYAYGSFVSSVTVPENESLVIFSSKSIYVKGIYDFPVTVASRINIVLAGDFVDRSQGERRNAAGLVAANHVFVPHWIPTGNLRKADWDSAEAAEVNGFSNFPVDWDFATNSLRSDKYPILDRDTGNTDYSTELPSWADCTTNLLGDERYGCVNLPSHLDIDASIFAMGNTSEAKSGKFKVETYGEWDLDPITGRGAMGDDGVMYKWTPNDTTNTATNPGSLMMDANGDDFPDYDASDPSVGWRNPGVKALYWDDLNTDSTALPTGVPDLLPQFRSAVPSIYPSLPLNNSLDGVWEAKSRSTILQLNIFGGLITKGHSPTGSGQCPLLTWNICGVGQRRIKFNPLFLTIQPPAFPHSPQVDVVELLRKTYTGAPVLEMAEVIPSPTPVPTPTPLATPDCSSGGTCFYEN